MSSQDEYIERLMPHFLAALAEHNARCAPYQPIREEVPPIIVEYMPLKQAA